MTVLKVKVEALAEGYINNRLMMPGDKFEVAASLFSENWMKKIDEEPALPIAKPASKKSAAKKSAAKKSAAVEESEVEESGFKEGA